MHTIQGPDRRTGSIAIALGAVIASTSLSFGLFAAFGEPFGSVSDISVGISALISGVLASRLYASHRSMSPTLALVALGFAWAGAVIMWVGSYLVVSGTTGYFLASLVSTFGYALIGLWLLILALSGHAAVVPTPTARRLPLLASVLLAIGILVLPGIISQMDDPETASLLANLVPPITWLGILAYLIWAFVFGRRMRAVHQSPSTELG